MYLFPYLVEGGERWRFVSTDRGVDEVGMVLTFRCSTLRTGEQAEVGTGPPLLIH
jgi:hypothetical protein